MHARGSSGEQIRLCHVAGPIAEESDPKAGERPAVLADGEQVGEKLAGVEVIGKAVDDRDRGTERHLLEAGLGVGTPDDRGNLALEHARGVGGGLLTAELTVRRGDDERNSPEVGDSDSEAHAGAGRRLVENHGDGLWPSERLVGESVSLELCREVENLRLLGL